MGWWMNLHTALSFSTLCDILYKSYCAGMWRSLVAHFVRDEGAAGSNPVIPIGVHWQIICRDSQIRVVFRTLMSLWWF